MIHSPSIHLPILVDPIVRALTEPFAFRGGSSERFWIVDCTLGGGGHTRAILGELGRVLDQSKYGVLALDRDMKAVERARETFREEIAQGLVEVRHCRMSEYRADRPILGILADLGFSSDQMDDPKRGFSFQSPEPLDMRMDRSQGRSAADVLREVDEEDLANLIFKYGEERFSRRIAATLIRARQAGELPSSGSEIAELIRRAYPPPARHGRIHPATRSFQALRIFVNEELEELDCFLRQVILELKPGGRAAVLSFHSLEDRMVKNRFRQLSRHPEPTEGEWKDLTKKPIDPDDEEVSRNPRARSAHLRLLEREK